MAKLDASNTLQRLRNRYRLVILNDDTYEEVVTFKLSRLSVYVVFCSIFVILVGLTVGCVVWIIFVKALDVALPGGIVLEFLTSWF